MKKKNLNNVEIISRIEEENLKKNLPQIRVGDTVQLGVEITEGEKTRIQNYEGVILAIKNSGINKTITVRKVMQGIGVERVFLVNSPRIKEIRIKRSAKVRRSKLYFLQKLSGKATRLKQRFN